ncbi:beta-1,3-N-acetylglucosaminyltransferase lunatic fringe-like [Dysidea avara]|uniref:beta-1,3-N-acetylglucosaminyltransferase lunatic fringe-like n=1 Tax=Dysidea avara TaxID=196820 RepID=UPI00331EA40F
MMKSNVSSSYRSVCFTVVLISLCAAVILWYNSKRVGVASSIDDNRKQSAQEKELTIFDKKLEEVHTGYGSNIFFSVKTCNRLYRKRLFYQMLTWFQAVDKNKLSIVSDDPNAAVDDIALIKKSGFNLLLSNCEPSHDLYSLCCKSAAEFSLYYRELDKHKNEEDKYQWYCHFDDDMYVNIPALGKLLEQYDPHQPYYIGRWPKEVWGPMSGTYAGLNRKELDNIASFNYTVRRHRYWYAGGCGYCLSHAVMMEARRILLGDVNYCKVTLNTDDVSVGIVAGAILGINLTDIDEIHSQRENLSLSSLEQTMNYVTVSANRLVNLKTPFPDDKYGFMALHCLLYPSVSWCQHQKIVTQT